MLLPQFPSKPNMMPMHPSSSYRTAAPSLPITSLGFTQPPLRPTPLALHSHIRVLKRRGRRMLRELQSLQQQIEMAERELWLAGNFGG